MGEKRGGTGKLSYDFPTQAVLEVKINGTWYRASSRDFRSFNGERRLTFPTNPKSKQVVNVPMTTQEYSGPVFLYNTNTEVPYTGEGKIVTGESWNDTKKASQKQDEVRYY